MASTETKRRLSVAEYLQIEERAECKSEFFDGEMYAMSGGTLQHSRIGLNLGWEFNQVLKSRTCVPYNSDLRIKIEATGLFTYPDLSVICGPAETASDDPNAVVNPSVLVEVLSKSTEAYDRITKFEHYRQIPSLREYLLVSQTQPRIERIQRQADGAWLWSVFTGLDASVELPSLDVSIRLGNVYSRVEFPPEALNPLIPPG